ncbi:MAG: hypothetical protein ACTSRB_04550 [Candidatus Helarchaeota archaeon]
MVVAGLKKHWMRVIIITAMFLGAGLVPTFIETQILPMAQTITLLDDYVDPNSPVIIDVEKLLNDIDSLEMVQALSDDKQTTLRVTLKVVNNKTNLYPMKIPAVNLDIYYKAGRPYYKDSEILVQFKQDSQFRNVTELYEANDLSLEYDYYSWVRVMNIHIPMDYVILNTGQSQLIELYLTLHTNGEEEGNALSQMLGNLIRTQKISPDSLYIKGVVSIGGIQMPIDTDPVSLIGEEISFADMSAGGTGDLSSMMTPLLALLLDETPRSLISSILGDLGRFIHLADIRNYNDTNGNGYRDWNDINGDGLKGADESFSEPLLENGTFYASVFLKLRDLLAVDNLDIGIPASKWNIEEGQIAGDPKGKIEASISENSIWGTSDQQLLLYLPDTAAEAYNKTNWKNRVMACIGFPETTLDMDNVIGPRRTPGGNYTIPLYLGANLKICGDARSSSEFGPGDAIGALLEMFLDDEDRGLYLGIMGNIKIKLGQMPLSISFDLPLDLGQLMGSEETQETESSDGALSGMMDILGSFTDYFGITDIQLHGAAIDTFNQVLQTNVTLIMDNSESDDKDGGFFFPYGLYFPQNEDEAENFLAITGGPLQLFNQTLPDGFDSWSDTAKDNWYKDHLVMNFSIDSRTMEESLKHVLIKLGSINNGMGIAYNFKSPVKRQPYVIGSYSTFSTGYYSNTMELLLNDEMINPEEEYRTKFEMTIDQLRLDLNDLFPEFGEGFKGLLTDLDINPTLIDYLNKSLDDWGTRTGKGSGVGDTGTLMDFLSLDPTLFMSLLNQPGEDNDLLEFMVDEGYLNQTHSTFNLTALVEGILNIAGDDLLSPSSSGSGGEETDLFELLIDVLDASGLKFDELIPVLFDFLRREMSYEYGIKPFELMDVVMNALGFSDLLGSISGGGSSGAPLSISEESLDTLFDYVIDLLSVIEPFDLVYTFMNDPLPYMDYLNRSGLLSEGFLLPLIISLFEGGQAGGMELDLGPILRNIGDVLDPILFGEPEFGINPVNLLSLLQSPESVTKNGSSLTTQLLDYVLNLGAGDKVYYSGAASYLADMPPYYGLRLLGKMVYALMQAGLDSNMLYQLLADMGILDLSGMQGGAISGPGAGESEDLLGGLGDVASLISVMGYLVPPGEWASLLRELGIWSDWVGDMVMYMDPAYVDIYGAINRNPFYLLTFQLGDLINPMLENLRLLNLKKFLATGKLEVMTGFGGLATESFDLGLSLALQENQSYGNPYYYQRGYDSSAYDNYNRGPYHEYYNANVQILPGDPGPNGWCDNWGWVPLGWDPGWYSLYDGETAGDPSRNWTSHTSSEYKTSFLTDLIGNLPLSIDIDIPEFVLDFTDPPMVEDLEIYVQIFSILGIEIGAYIYLTLGIYLWIAMQTSIRLRMEGNIGALVERMQDEGLGILGLARHFAGGDMNTLIADLMGDMTSLGEPTEEEGTSTYDELFDAIFNDMPTLISAFFDADTDLYHYVQYLLDPKFMPAQTWYLDGGYQKWDVTFETTDPTPQEVTISNPVEVSLYWDVDWTNFDFSALPDAEPSWPTGYNVTQTPYFGDDDQIPDEYPWYRFTRPVYNQENPDSGPGNYQQADVFRYPQDKDDLTPTGYPGQGQWSLGSDGVTDGLQHYWYDTPYAYANATVKSIDPWPNIDPDRWNDISGLSSNQGQYYYEWGPVWVDAADLPIGYDAGWYKIFWGEGAPLAKGQVNNASSPWEYHPMRADFPFEQVPLIQINGRPMDDIYWDPSSYSYSDLYRGYASDPNHPVFKIHPTQYNSYGSSTNNFGSTSPDDQISDINSEYPDIWACFQWTLDDFDYRMGQWATQTDYMTGIDWDYLDVKPFYNLMALGVSPHLPGAISTFDVPSLVADLLSGDTLSGGVGGQMGSDFYRKEAYNRTYSLFEPDLTYVEHAAPFNSTNMTLIYNSTNVGAITALDLKGEPVWTQMPNTSRRKL